MSTVIDGGRATVRAAVESDPLLSMTLDCFLEAAARYGMSPLELSRRLFGD